ncbi:hypothetical protein [Nitrosomonas ureae]|uniref:20S proteasome, alpha and beta subunits n=1 Tax=Nitrosomonas ureae TaxID=44577 RepID=A0A1H2ENY4_9PROT|nr:hypothetical protein [Nitrosomonas ureae]ALQ51903.1 hypothetical protein ATY38_12145 [Nitrosomonas ureae]SDT96815.1 20S proteasome, alpha and beta subunits [Nitrosomonas ureae]
MTTIAYKDGIIAYDSRVRAGDLIIDDNIDKHFHVGNDHFFISGDIGQADEFIHCAQSGSSVMRYIDIHAIAILEGKLLIIGIEEIDGHSRMYKDIPRLNYHYAVGSGMRFALAAMDMGASAKESIELAMKRDSCTGGTIRTFEFK